MRLFWFFRRWLTSARRGWFFCQVVSPPLAGALSVVHQLQFRQGEFGIVHFLTDVVRLRKVPNAVCNQLARVQLSQLELLITFVEEIEMEAFVQMCLPIYAEDALSDEDARELTALQAKYAIADAQLRTAVGRLIIRYLTSAVRQQNPDATLFYYLGEREFLRALPLEQREALQMEGRLRLSQAKHVYDWVARKLEEAELLRKVQLAGLQFATNSESHPQNALLRELELSQEAQRAALTGESAARQGGAEGPRIRS